MAIFVTGDVHGGHDLQKIREWEAGEGLCRSDYLVVAGDFGYPWDYSDEECEEILWLESRPYTVLFVDGNHERFDHWRERPYEEWRGGRVQRLHRGSPIRRLCRGEVFDLDGFSVFTMGGATSTDRDSRTPYFDWWPCELPDEDDFERARANLDAFGWEVDYVVTHTCADRLLSTTLYPLRGWDAPGHDRLTRFLDQLEERLTFKRWYYGHFHRDMDVDERHTVLYQKILPMGESLESAP